MTNLTKARQEFSHATHKMYDALREVIKKNGGFIDTQNESGELDTIFSLDCSDDTYECNVLAIRVKGGEIQYVSEYGSCCNYTREELEDMDWTSLKCGDNYYVQTLYNICDSIGEYIPKEK